MYTKPLEFAEYPQLTKLLADTLVDSEFVCKRWGVSKSHLGNLRRLQRGIPFIRLPLAKPGSAGKACIRYRLSDIIAAEVNGVSGAVNVQRVMLALETSGLPAEPLEAITKHLAKELSR